MESNQICMAAEADLSLDPVTGEGGRMAPDGTSTTPGMRNVDGVRTESERSQGLSEGDFVRGRRLIIPAVTSSNVQKVSNCKLFLSMSTRAGLNQRFLELLYGGLVCCQSMSWGPRSHFLAFWVLIFIVPFLVFDFRLK